MLTFYKAYQIKENRRGKKIILPLSHPDIIIAIYSCLQIIFQMNISHISSNSIMTIGYTFYLTLHHNCCCSDPSLTFKINFQFWNKFRFIVSCKDNRIPAYLLPSFSSC